MPTALPKTWYPGRHLFSYDSKAQSLPKYDETFNFENCQKKLLYIKQNRMDEEYRQKILYLCPQNGMAG